MKMGRRYVLSLAVAFLLGLAGMYLYLDQGTVYPSDRVENDIREAKQRNDTLTKENQRLGILVDQLHARSDSLLNIVQNNRKELIELENERNEKIRAIGTYGHMELYRFFTGFETDSIHNRD